MSAPDLRVPNTDPRERLTLDNFLSHLDAQVAELRTATAGLDARVPADPRAANAYAAIIGAAQQQALEVANVALIISSHLGNRELAIYRAPDRQEPRP